MSYDSDGRGVRMFYYGRIAFYRPLPLIHNGGICKMERLVFENPSHDEFDLLVLVLLLIIIIAIGSLPLLLMQNGLTWSTIIWLGAISLVLVGYWSFDSKKLKFIHIENSGIGLQLKKGEYRRIGWRQVDTIKPIEGHTDGRWLLLVFPFAYSKEDVKEEKEGLLLLEDGSRYRISWEIAEAVHAGHYESTGKWLT
jgi:hypothetical protein